MSAAQNLPPVIETIPEKCRRCYSCIRECPARAIKVEGGQARVIPERCIGCGNCYRVCSQGAKRILDGREHVRRLLAAGDRPRVAMLAPSFPAAYMDIEPDRIVGALRALGFDKVCEVAFGADLNSRIYHEMRSGRSLHPTITTACPAIVYFVQKYAPELVPHLAPVASPMVVMARLARRLWGENAAVVFIGPCVGKKLEARDPHTDGVVDEVLTFQELNQLFADEGIDPVAAPVGEMDSPRSGLGLLFPVQSGLLKSADIQEAPLDSSILSTNGRRRCMWVLQDLTHAHFDMDFVDLLMCEGCINGPSMSNHHSLFQRKERVVTYAREQVRRLDMEEWIATVDTWLDDVDQGRIFEADPQRLAAPPTAEIEAVLQRMGKQRAEDELNCGACGYGTCREKAEAVCKGLAEVEMCLPFLIDKLERTCGELQETNVLLQTTQESLIQSEKLASMGQLAAGVAHEINNPLGSILMFSHLLLETLAGSPECREDLEFIVREAQRCKTIVSGLLNFSRQNRIQLVRTDIGTFLGEIVRERELDERFAGIRFRLDIDPAVTAVWMDAEQLRQVLDNLIHNAAEAMDGRGDIRLEAQSGGDGEDVILAVTDSGCGIPEENLKRIFTPFFTTKKLGKGTGLGLAIVYGIMKMHRGQVDVESRVGAGTTFRLTLPNQPPVTDDTAWI